MQMTGVLKSGAGHLAKARPFMHFFVIDRAVTVVQPQRLSSELLQCCGVHDLHSRI